MKNIVFIFLMSIFLAVGCSSGQPGIGDSYKFCKTDEGKKPLANDNECTTFKNLFAVATASSEVNSLSIETAKAIAISKAEKKLVKKIEPELIKSLTNIFDSIEVNEKKLDRSILQRLTTKVKTDFPIKGRVYKSIVDENKKNVHVLIGINSYDYISLMETLFSELNENKLKQTNNISENDQPDWERKNNHSLVPVYYMTNRKKTGKEKWAKFYGFERGPISFGISHVTIPKSHKIGQIEEPSLFSIKNKKEHVTIDKLEQLDKDSFFEGLQDQRNTQKSQRKVFVFIHGFATHFAIATQRAAQIAFDLKFKGTPVVFSWPSQGSSSPLAYTADENNMNWSMSTLKSFLLDILALSGASEIHLIAHSMGSRALAGALRSISTEMGTDQSHLFSEIIFFAPDIDSDYFKKEIIPKIKKVSKGITLYASSNDMALKLSKTIHGDMPRAGDSGDMILVAPEITTIDVSEIDDSMDGHSYYSENRSVLQDLFLLLNFGFPSEKRNLLKKDFGDSFYWLIRP